MARADARELRSPKDVNRVKAPRFTKTPLKPTAQNLRNFLDKKAERPADWEEDGGMRCPFRLGVARPSFLGGLDAAARIYDCVTCWAHYWVHAHIFINTPDNVLDAEESIFAGCINTGLYTALVLWTTIQDAVPSRTTVGHAEHATVRDTGPNLSIALFVEACIVCTHIGVTTSDDGFKSCITGW
jgi:hypothetical protein